MAKSNFIVRGGGDFSGLYKEFNNAQKKMKSFQTGMSKALKGLGAIISTLAIGKVVKDSLNAASELEGAMLGLESIVVGQGKSFDKAKGFINSYIKDGLVPLTDAVTAYKNLSMRGYDDEQIKTIMERLKDSAAFGRQGSLTLGEAVRSATEGLKNENSILVDNAGVTKNVSMMWKDYAKQLGKGVNSLTLAEKRQAEVNGIMQETQFQVGNAAMYTNTYAGRLAALKKTLFDIKVNLGNAFMPIANIVLPLLQSLANKLADVTANLSAFTQALFGKATTVNQTEKKAAAIGDLGDATEEAGKKAKGALAGFDEINKLGKTDAGAGTSTGVGAIENPLVEQTDDGTGGAMGQMAIKAAEAAKKIKTAFTNIKNAIVENKDIILPALGAIVGALAGLAAYSGITSLVSSFKLFITAIKLAWATLLAHPMIAVAAAIGALVGALVTAYLTNDEFRASVDKVWERIKTSLTPVIEALGKVLTWLWQSVILPVARVLVDVLKVAFDGISYSVKWLWEYVLAPLGNFIMSVLWPIFEALAKLLINILKFAVEAVINTFEFLWYNVLKPLTIWLGNTFKPVFEVVGKIIKTIIEGLQLTFEGLIIFITGVFTKDWKTAWEGVKKIFKGTFGTLWEIAKTPLNLIIDGINQVIDALNSLSIDIPDWVPKFGGQTWGIDIPNIPRLATGAITGVNDPFMAVVGDNKTQREVISPLDDLLGMITTAVSSAVGNGGDMYFTFKIGEDTITEKVISNINRQSRISGQTVITL